MKDYKEKYEKALERAKFLKENTDGIGAIDVNRCFEEIFPELKESEDDRIRKAIVEFFELQDENTTYSFVSRADILAWLEKQGEQKPIWGEEDEKLLNLSLGNLTEFKDRFGEKYGKVGECIDWLKSLKERMKGE